MTRACFLATAAFALVALPNPVAAQMHMPGMTMPMPAKPAIKKKPAAKKPAAKKKTVKKAQAKKARARRAPAKHAPASKTAPPPASQQGADMSGMNMPAQSPGSPQPMPPMDHSQMPQSSMPTGQGAMAGMAHAGHEMTMAAALGPYPIARESSGTAWQPDASEHGGVMRMSGDSTLMAHGVLNLVTDHQSGPRGDDKAFASGMLMGMASRPLGNGTLQLKAMVSPDPLMGPSGYPLLLASGETADGVTRLVDRQHPHDFFMELSGSVSQNIGAKSSVFVYGGLPAEPAFGPPAFMHREAILDSPEAPISHHWLDSTHISFGVLTAGLVLDRIKIEASRFNGREPDRHRWDIETGPLDSTSVRVSWNPTSELALQGSWGHFVDPEQLEPGVDQERWSASALYARDIAPGWKLAGTLAWGRKSAQGHNDDALALEGSLKHASWTIFARGEMIENRELTDVDNGPAYRVGKMSLGAVRDFKIAEHFSIGAGGLFALNFVPEALAPLYGGHNPTGAMAFVRLKLD
jgi:hypothetical protein